MLKVDPSAHHNAIVLDTETTGLSYREGHRIIELGCVEIDAHCHLTGRTYHRYIDPQREIPSEARAVHGLDLRTLRERGAVPFAQVVQSWLDFIGLATLIIHNAPFDVDFLNYELDRTGRPPLANKIIDSFPLAQTQYPNDAALRKLCKRLDVPVPSELHGALLDSQLLAECYRRLQLRAAPPTLNLRSHASDPSPQRTTTKEYRPPRPHHASPQEYQDHQRMLEKLTDPIWLSD